MLAHAGAGAETKRPDIARAALRLFLERGVRGATVRAIAARAGVAEGTLYRHWRSKRDLARTLFQECAAAVAADVRRAAAAEASSRDALGAALHVLFAAARDETLLYELLALPPGPEGQALVASAESPSAVLAEVIAEGQRRRELVDVDPQLAAEAVLGAVHRVAIARRLGTLPRRLAEYETEMVAGVLATLSARRRRTIA